MRKNVIVVLCALALAMGFAVASSADICNGFGTCGGGGHHQGSGGGGLPANGGPTLSISDAIGVSGKAPGTQGGKNVVAFEGDDCMFTVKLKDGSKIASADWETKDGSAHASGQPGDYTQSSGQVIIDPHEKTNKAFIFVHTNNDPFSEGDETFFVVLSHAHNAVITDGKGKCVIHDSTPPPPTD